MMYKCTNCGKIFYEPREVKTTYESYYGVSSEFPNSTPMIYTCCPYCGDEDYKDIEDEEDEDE